MARSIDEIIREAMERGEFNNLPNTGKKLNLDDYFSIPEDVRLGYSLLKSADFVPEEVQLLQEIAALQEKIAATSTEDEKKKLFKVIEDRRLRYNLLMERSRHHRGAGF